MLKVARASHGEKKDELEEYSTDDYGNMYFAFCKVTTHEADGGSRVSEERTYLDDSETLQKTRRTASFPAGVAPEIAAKAPAEKLAIAKSSDEARTLNNTTSEVIAALCVPERLAHDPAKDAPAEWQRVKLVQGSLSPDGHTALAIAPKKETFAWADHADSPLGGYTMEVDAAVNYLADLQTHRLLGKTLGTHFGTRARYNHRQCIFAWSPDSRIFLQLDVAKWSYVDCCIGQLRDGKLAPVQDLGAAVETRAKEFLAATKTRLPPPCKRNGHSTLPVRAAKRRHWHTPSLARSAQVRRDQRPRHHASPLPSRRRFAPRNPRRDPRAGVGQREPK